MGHHRAGRQEIDTTPHSRARPEVHTEYCAVLCCRLRQRQQVTTPTLGYDECHVLHAQAPILQVYICVSVCVCEYVYMYLVSRTERMDHGP